MPISKKILSWSSGKDAAYTLHRFIKQNMKPDLLLTTVNKDYERVSMHGLRVSLLEQQAKALNIPLYTIPLSKDVDMATYNDTMYKHLNILKEQGFDTVIYGDILLEDLKTYREKQMAKVNMKPEFPIWKRNTKQLARDIINSGIKALIVSTNAKLLDQSFVGRPYDKAFLNDIPENVDWCGENGEFHTFVYDSPDFNRPIPYRLGFKTFKEYKPCSKKDQENYNKSVKKSNWDTGFWYIDVLPA
jgi:uncharacterized protein (TIGR00290 family)